MVSFPDRGSAAVFVFVFVSVVFVIVFVVFVFVFVVYMAKIKSGLAVVDPRVVVSFPALAIARRYH